MHFAACIGGKEKTQQPTKTKLTKMSSENMATPGALSCHSYVTRTFSLALVLSVA
ncbi:hypothetical protein ACRRTK_012193 [Alexandromys fortis]